MDDIRFDHLSRRLGTRRATLGGLLGGAFVLGALAESDAKKKKKKKKKKKTFCQLNPNNTECNSGTTGRCLNGVCNPQPSCDVAGASCTTGDPQTCCSVTCTPDVGDAGNCALSVKDQVCQTSADCLSGSCVGYRCQ
ncbi:MAG: hypothetical protein QM692_08060 [Thermomicrobiales bacterium]